MHARMHVVIRCPRVRVMLDDPYMEDEAFLGVRHHEDALHPKDVGSFRLDQPANPGLQQVEVELTFVHGTQVPRCTLVQAHARHGAVMLRFGSLGIEQLCVSSGFSIGEWP